MSGSPRRETRRYPRTHFANEGRAGALPWEKKLVEHLDVSLFVFMLATFLGLEVIRRVSPLLHTPLMSLTNAISAITVVGAILVAGAQATPLTTVLGTAAVAASTINIVGGYLITYRMLRMFKKSEKGKR